MLPASRLRVFRGPLALFGGVTLVSIAGLAWLSWRVLTQDRVVERQRWLDRGDSMEAAHGTRLPYYPSLPDAGPRDAELFREAETLEFRENQPLKAAELYSRATGRPEPEVRAGALIRLARAYRRANRMPEVLEAYNRLEKLGPVIAEGEPPELMARLGRSEIHAQAHETAALRREAAEIIRALAGGRWFLRRGSHELLSEQTRAWLDGPLPSEPSAEMLALADTVETVWSQWREGTLEDASPLRRRSYWVCDRSILALWETRPDRLVLLAAAPGAIEAALGPFNRESAGGPRRTKPHVVRTEPGPGSRTPLDGPFEPGGNGLCRTFRLPRVGGGEYFTDDGPTTPMNPGVVCTLFQSSPTVPPLIHMPLSETGFSVPRISLMAAWPRSMMPRRPPLKSLSVPPATPERGRRPNKGPV